MLLEIAGFIAGNNDYGTLLSFTLMSKVIKQEMEPILYETVFVWNVKDLKREPEIGGQEWLDAYKYTKCVHCRCLSSVY
jgi:hypothetical protein